MSAGLLDPRPAPPVRVTKPDGWLRACEHCGVAFRGKSGNANRFCSNRCANSKHDPAFVAAARRHWRQGFSLSEIAAVLGVTKGVISGIKTRRNGFPPRPSPIRRNCGMKIALALNGRARNGFVASIEDDDSGLIYLTDDPAETSAPEACAEAARKLREAAARFDLLAHKRNPAKATVQDTVNRAKVSA